jgi:hypothetical protein
MKQGSLFLFHFVVLRCLRSWGFTLHSLLVSLKSPRWVGVHRLGLRLFGAMVWKLLIVESFSQWILNKIETQNYLEIWVALLESPWWIGFNRVYFTIFKAKGGVEDIHFLMDFVAENSNKLQKIGFGTKNQLNPQCVHNCTGLD